ncbi:MAG: HAMP domain-containing protein [Bacteroidales bacterium]|nr:HAMP domain-containing protein [Bacteroidales bacterium]
MKKRILIREKLVLIFLLLGVIVEFVISAFYYYNAKEALLERTHNQLSSVRIEKQYRVEKFFADRKRDLKIITISPNLISIFEDLRNPYFNGNIKNKFDSFYSEFLQYFINEEINYEKILLVADTNSISFLKNKNTLFLSKDLVLYEGIVDKILKDKQIHFEDLKQIDNKSLLILGAPVIKQDSVLGVFIVVLSVDALNRILLDNNPNYRMGESGETYLVGKDFLMRSTSRFLNNSELEIEVKTNGVNRALYGKTGFDVFPDYRGIEVLSSYSPLRIDGLDWAILSEIDLEEAMIPIYSIRNRIILISLLIALVIFVFSFYVAGKISDPIVKINKAANNVAVGNYSTILSVNRTDELGELSDSFNKMTKQIEIQTKEIIKERQFGLKAMIEGQEIERQRLSREIHDGLGQTLIAMKLKLENMSNCRDKEVNSDYEHLINLIDTTIQETRNIINNLSPSILKEFGLIKTLAKLSLEIQKQMGINILFDGEKMCEEISDYSKVFIFRIIQEGLSNIVKHADAKEVSIQLFFEQEELILTIEDNGKGFDYKTYLYDMIPKNGLINIKERVSLLNGKFDINSKIGIGTIITIRIPKENLLYGKD